MPKRTPRVTVRLSDDEINALYAALGGWIEDRTEEELEGYSGCDGLSNKLLHARARVRKIAQPR